MYRYLFAASLLFISGCATRMSAGRGTGFSALDLSIGMLPVSGSLNPNQNMFPGLAGAIDGYGFFKSVEPVAANPNKQFDLLLMAEPPGFAPRIKVVSAYTNEVLYEDKILALYGAGAGKAARRIYKAFKTGSPAHQRIMAQRLVHRSKTGGRAPAAAPPAPAYSSDIDAPGYSRPENPDDFAVVVGIEKYSNLPPAEFAERDARAVVDHLNALGYPRRNIIHLTGDRASRAGLAKHLETWLPRNVKAASTVFFYYSGHGAPDIETRQAYLVPYDGDPQFLKDTGYPVAKLYKSLQALPARRVIVALDACFSGAGGRSVIPKGTRPLVTKVDAAFSGNKTIVFSASAADEITGTDESQGHGLFTYHFLRGLNGAAKNARGRVTARSLFNYLAPKVEDDARRRNRSQTPQLYDGAAEADDLTLNKF